MENSHKIIFSPPVELNFNCDTLNKNDIKCSQAFPDLARYGERIYLSFRSAPSHFPSNHARIQIFSTLDFKNFNDWHFEHSISHTQDIRDPHFLKFKDELYLFYMSHSKSMLNHKPEHIYYIKKNAHGWNNPAVLPLNRSGFWNVKTFNNQIYMSIYTRNCAENRAKKDKRRLQFISSRDLINWEVVFDSPLARQKLGWYQTSEAAFDFDPKGNIFGTVRSVIYPNLNFSIPAGEPENWKLKVDTFKCDGPNLFSHNGQYFLIARRSLYYRLSSQPFRLFHNLRKAINVMRYSLSKKRTAIYGFDPDKLDIQHITDLPSHGDTGYSAIVKLAGNKYLLIYYSSDINNGQDLNWLAGQTDRTKLYASVITVK